MPDDRAFLYRVYAGTRAAELALVDWDATQQAAFLEQQFSAQHEYYQAHYVGADFAVILRAGQPVGRLYVARWAQEIRIVDIALLAEHQGAGIGTQLLTALLAEGTQTQKLVSIHVEQFNPALRLYQRLGFIPVSLHGIYYLMHRLPPPQGTPG